ncbi:MAG TPA: hypothetical protein PL155_09030 [Candidatus Omnitrophota bacterium]|nr:hypothetical protein [Candidatus Omnitrophota bacterium]HPD85401.1 hypothetical protein [Candidatus Omnitrophota bacterium]HRZ04098.1 hypothetical protein [Candidatus Omnitrophota bacterium]
MKKLTAFLIFLIFLCAVSTAYAHPPSEIKITFDPNTKILTAVIMHSVSNPLSHYIGKVDIGLNGTEIASLNFSRQENNQSQTVTYTMPDVKKSDVIFVEGYCNISGKLKKEITVEKESTPDCGK